MQTSEQILEIIKRKGPVIPVQISKEVGLNILMASAHLAELSSSKKVKVSHVKIGGTPLYYLPGQEPMLQRFSDNLHEKEKTAYNLLNQKKVLRDKDLEPLTRVALRNTKDYAIPLQVTHKGNSEIFWKWYLLENSQAEDYIRNLLSPQEEQEAKPQQEIKKLLSESEKDLEKAKSFQKEGQAVLEAKQQEEQKKPVKPKKQPASEFLNTITAYFNRNKISILSKEQIRSSEIDFIIQLPTPVGNLEYYCKAKDKQKINDGDLASAYIQGQSRKLPVLLVTNGELTKRAKEMLQKEFKGMGIKKL